MKTARTDVHSLALHKVAEVLGPTRAHDLLASFLADHPADRLSSPSDLAAFGSCLDAGDAPEQAVGAALRRYARILAS
ncbi:MAG: hypothetical protein JNL82_30820 [Myxococcales bacterium]|nr:hypothetical protein [Myxococcales bacterium]